MASIFWNAEGVLLVDYLDKGHTITEGCYADYLRRLRENNVADSAWSAVPPGQFSSTPGHIGHGCYPEIWIPTCRSPTIFS